MSLKQKRFVLKINIEKSLLFVQKPSLFEPEFIQRVYVYQGGLVMKRRLLFLLLSIGVVTLMTSCGNQPTEEAQKETETVVYNVKEDEKGEEKKEEHSGVIDSKAALGIALKDAGVKEDEIKELEIEEKSDDGLEYFEIEFEYEDNEYEYEISKEGKIMEKETGSRDRDKETSDKQGLISPDEAKKIALDSAGVNESEIEDNDQDLDHDDGSYVYEIEFEIGDSDFKFKIDAVTGSILKEEIDD